MRVAGCGLRDAGCGMRDAGCGLRSSASRKVRDAGCGLQNRTKLPFSASIKLISLVCVLFDPAIPTSFFNFIQLFLYLLYMGHMHAGMEN